MSEGGKDARTTLDAWRQQGTDRLDPMRFQCIDALARRAAGQQGAVRRLLDARLDGLIGDYAAALAQGARRDCRAAPAVRAPSALSALLEHTARQRQPHKEPECGGTAALPLPAWGGLDDVRRMCTHARSESQMRQALEQAPVDAGPLNSASLVHRALTLMRDVSPEYLAPFVSYVDALAWLGGMEIHGARTVKSTGTPAGGGTRPRGKVRGRRT